MLSKEMLYIQGELYIKLQSLGVFVRFHLVFMSYQFGAYVLNFSAYVRLRKRSANICFSTEQGKISRPCNIEIESKPKQHLIANTKQY